jgi:hypothetical protein
LIVFRIVISELIGMFVDDGHLALLAVLGIAAVTAAVKLLGFPALGGALLLLAACIAVLADSVRRAARRRS